MAYWPSRYSLWLSWNQAFHQWFWESQQLITWATGDINVKPKVLKPNLIYSNQPSKVSPVPQGSSKTGFSTRGQISIYVKIVREMTVFSLCCDFTRFLVGRFRWRQKQILPFFNPASNQNKRYSKDNNDCKWKLCKKNLHLQLNRGWPVVGASVRAASVRSLKWKEQSEPQFPSGWGFKRVFCVKAKEAVQDVEDVNISKVRGQLNSSSHNERILPALSVNFQLQVFF